MWLTLSSTISKSLAFDHHVITKNEIETTWGGLHGYVPLRSHMQRLGWALKLTAPSTTLMATLKFKLAPPPPVILMPRERSKNALK